MEREAEEKAKRAGEHEMQVSLGGKSGDGVRAAASEDAGTSPASSQVLFSIVPIVTRCELIVHALAMRVIKFRAHRSKQSTCQTRAQKLHVTKFCTAHYALSTKLMQLCYMYAS